MQGAQDGYKAWRVEPDSELSILRKVMDPVSSTIELSYLDGMRVSFVFGCGGMMFAGTDDGLYVQQQGESGFSRFILNVPDGSGEEEDEDEDAGDEDAGDDALLSEKCTGYYVYGSVILVSTVSAVYCLTIGEDN